MLFDSVTERAIYGEPGFYSLYYVGFAIDDDLSDVDDDLNDILSKIEILKPEVLMNMFPPVPPPAPVPKPKTRKNQKSKNTDKPADPIPAAGAPAPAPKPKTRKAKKIA